MSQEEEDERPGAALTLTSAVFVPGVEVVVLGIAENKEHYNGSCFSFRIAMAKMLSLLSLGHFTANRAGLRWSSKHRWTERRPSTQTRNDCVPPTLCVCVSDRTRGGVGYSRLRTATRAMNALFTHPVNVHPLPSQEFSQILSWGPNMILSAPLPTSSKSLPYTW